jgi:hypothetical protein
MHSENFHELVIFFLVSGERGFDINGILVSLSKDGEGEGKGNKNMLSKCELDRKAISALAFP